jgi:ankyrin repeat protein
MQVNSLVAAGPLHNAAEMGDIDLIIRLHKQGVDLNLRDDFNMTALHFASYFGQSTVVDYLLKNHIEVNGKNDGGYTALILAIDNGHTEISKKLINYGADVNIKASDSESPLSIAWSKGNDEIVRLLIRHGANVNVESIEQPVKMFIGDTGVKMPVATGECPSYLVFHDILRSNDYNMIKLFLDNGANPNTKCTYADLMGNRVITINSLDMTTSKKVRKLLISYGAKDSKRSSINDDDDLFND